MADTLLQLVPGLTILNQFDVDCWRVLDHHYDTSSQITNTLDDMILRENEMIGSSEDKHATKDYRMLKDCLRCPRFWEQRERELMERLRYSCQCGMHRIREVDGELFMYMRRNWKQDGEWK